MATYRVVAVLCIVGLLLTWVAWAQTVIPIKISPSTIVLAAPVQWVTVQTDLPYDAVDQSTVQLNGIDLAWAKASASPCGKFVAKFAFADVAELVAPAAPGQVTLTLTGNLVGGTAFEGSDTVWVK